jgi:hypothetical protein
MSRVDFYQGFSAPAEVGDLDMRLNSFLIRYAAPVFLFRQRSKASEETFTSTSYFRSKRRSFAAPCLKR